jgi:hypothetical protein
MAKAIAIVVAIVIIIVAVFGIYLGLTYPRPTANIPVSILVGVETETVALDQPFLDDKAQVQVTVQSGAALWSAQILNGTQILWSHTATQSDQESYTSDWIQLPSGSYNFTFGTIGGGLDATATVTSKGGFW